MEATSEAVLDYYGLADPFPLVWADTPEAARPAIAPTGADTLFSRRRRAGSRSEGTVRQESFEILVRAKSTLDRVYAEMKKDFLQANHEWGVGEIARQIDDANVRANQIMKPVMDNKIKGEQLKATLSLIEKNRYLFDLPATLADHIRRRDNDSLIRDYRRGRSMTDEIRVLPHAADLSPYAVQQRAVTERIWGEVEVVVEEFKSDAWKQLAETRPDGKYLDLIRILLELGVEDNPIMVWMQSQLEFLTSSLENTFDKLGTKVQLLRRELADGAAPTAEYMAFYFGRAIGGTAAAADDDAFLRDTPEVVKMWHVVRRLVDEVAQHFGTQISLFWACATGFLDGKTQKGLPRGQNGESRVHLALSEGDRNQIRAGTRDLIDRIARHVADFFLAQAAAVELPSKAAPRPAPAVIQRDGTSFKNSSDSLIRGTLGGSLSASAILANALNNDQKAPEEPPATPAPPAAPAAPATPAPGDRAESPDSSASSPTSPETRKSYELYAFLPPNANALSTTYFLAQIVGLLGTVASELAGLSVSPKHAESLRDMISTVRERCVGACCLAWQQDSKRFRILETWTPAADKKTTLTPALFTAYQSAVLAGVQQVLYVAAAEKKSKAQVVLPPSSKIVFSIKTQFVNSIFLTVDGLIKLAAASDSRTQAEALRAAGDSSSYSLVLAKATVPVKLDIRLLWMVCNISFLKTVTVPALFERFSTVFSIQLTDNTNIIGDALQQLDDQLFGSYVKKKRAVFSKLIGHGILESGTDWAALGKPQDVSAYVYESLLQLVMVHSSISSNAPSLVHRVIQDLLGHIARVLLDSFRKVPRFSLGGMLQATIDTEFINQKMVNYVTPDIDKLFQMSYSTVQDVTDKASLDVTTMTKQLDEMKKLLLRAHKNSRTEFWCFKKEKDTRPGDKGVRPSPSLARTASSPAKKAYA
ncbi:exocyst complex component Sec5-domain-containing protein [Dipodascopsis tothii]|uniref:exocyst complex component Sec5-domain-containing protein n=1 Tax=Dipodascopsis tothii TaxID=44089 RepID=UPI0034CE5CA9